MKYWHKDSEKRHQHGATVLMNFDVPCVTGFVLDFMHSVCQGVQKRMLTLWLNPSKQAGLYEPLRKCDRLSLDKFIKDMGTCMPSDFTRQELRGSEDIAYWKAKELRTFLLYSGPVLLRELFASQPDIYNHWLYLHAAIRALCLPDRSIREFWLPFARQWLIYFVDRTITIYGESFPVYNVHAMCHIADAVEKLGKSLDELSAFRFENHLQVIKNYINPSTKNACVSVARKLHALDKVCRRDTFKYIGTVGTGMHKSNDNSFYTTEGDLILINYENNDGTYTCDLYKKNDLKELYSKPCSSKDLYITVFDSSTPMRIMNTLERTKLKRKAVVLGIPNHPDQYVAVGVLHTMS